MSLAKMFLEIDQMNRQIQLRKSPEHQEKLRRRLVNLVEDYNTEPNLKAGDFVKFKEGMKDKTIDGPFLVVEVLKEPLRDNRNDAGSPYFNAPLDVRVATIGEDSGQLMHFYLDSRRLKAVKYDEVDVI